MKTTAIIILNYNNFEDTINCIESAEKINTASVKYIVVDNGSPRTGAVDALDDYLKSKFADKYLFLREGQEHPDSLPYCTFLVSEKNSGYACGNKKGLKLAYGDDEIESVMILNNDVLFVNDFIPAVNDNLWSREDYMLATPLVMARDGVHIDRTCARKRKPIGYIFLWFVLTFKDIGGVLEKYREKFFILKDAPEQYEGPMDIYMPSGSCFIAKKKDFDAINDFDSRTFLYFEEDILAAKIAKYEKKCLLVPSVRCIHLGSCSVKKSPSNFVFRAEINSARCYMKYYSGVGAVRYFLFYVVTTLSRIVHDAREKFRRK
jgi:GT2 family glycosyltransferase